MSVREKQRAEVAAVMLNVDAWLYRLALLVAIVAGATWLWQEWF